ncbi:hypothetical protein [Allomesorhizobium alhagi]|uniref:Uncharacterized protein n=1 Tax=Mesorhizobium alhagi CCNWXJ12-2 TaxID=1107882 RepID=H0HQS8_9HYPH|nr:hypothetical protein [Mesorhizobium alhagi]EHK56892.1 hypothetical protein MAXJ12_12542 [Mesorhizobium alhagi CCNWXJ12-2]
MKFFGGAFASHIVDQEIIDDLSEDEFNELTRWVIPVLPDEDDEVLNEDAEPAHLYSYEPAPRSKYARRR